jgi:hypothetical protein
MWVARKAIVQKIRDPYRICAGLCERLELLPTNPYAHARISQDVPVPISAGTESRGDVVLSFDLLILQRSYSQKPGFPPPGGQQENQSPY